jgi:hypothetical protein
MRRGQSLVEYAITVPIFLLILLGMVEFGFAFAHHLTMEYSTREGARTGAALANGSAPFRCSDPGNPDNEVDNQVIAAVQRVLTGAGSQIDIDNVGVIRIFKADATGQQQGNSYNLWVPGDGPAVDGVQLLFKKNASEQHWACSSRDNSAPAGVGSYPDSIGVSIEYDYQFITPLSSLMKIVGGGEMHMTDRTVMALNPTPQ